MEGPKSPKRRTLLQRGLFLLAGVLGLGAAERQIRGETAVAPPRPAEAPTLASATLRLYGRRRPPQAQGYLPGRSASEHVISYGDLVDPAAGTRVGEFSTNGFCPETPFGHQFLAASNIELQTFKLPDGTLFGIGAAGPGAGREQTYAILGGTGRFAGARGSYVARTTTPEPGGRDAVEFTLTLTA